MSDIDSLKENLENVNSKFEFDIDMEKLKKELIKKFSDYQQTMKFLTADAPIQVLCLPVRVQKILLDNGFLRVYDIFDVDFTKIKGLTASNIRDLTTCIDQFFSML